VDGKGAQEPSEILFRGCTTPEAHPFYFEMNLIQY